MRPRVALLAIAGCVAAGLPLAANAASVAPCQAPAPPPLKFYKPVYVDTNRAGGEPVTQVAQDGSIILSSHAGTTHIYKDPSAVPGATDFTDDYSNQTLNWRSTDNGRTWVFTGIAGMPHGPHSATSTGFSDPDLTMDANGTIYNTEIDLANVSVYASPDDGKSWPIGNPIAWSGDRPWLTGAGEDTVYLYVNSPKALLVSSDRGVTWSLVSTDFPADGKLIVDPLNRATGLIGPMGEGGAAISPDSGKTWKAYPLHVESGTQFFGTIAVDRAGWIYVVRAGGYKGASDKKADGFVVFSYFNRQTKTWSTPQELKTPHGDAMWPWIIAGDDGRVGVVWLQRDGTKNAFHVYAAYTLNAHGSKVACRGRTITAPPRWSVTDASGRSVHNAPICLSGTACNAATDFAAGDRRLGDFLTINIDRTGRLILASADTRLTNPLGGPKPVSNPIFIGQLSGARLLRHPDPVRPSRCLFPLTSC
ncbi:MAG: WD40/YVTN/BNR-like repeat-containing protein [Mycobacteriales bacterium]|nr:glycoside hydrolase [Frankia sp.]